MQPKIHVSVLGAFAVMFFVAGRVGAHDSPTTNLASVPADIRAIFDKPLYKNAIWGLRVVDTQDGEVLINLEPDYPFIIGSVRKVFSIGELLNQVGADHTYDTPVYRQGGINRAGVLYGDLILKASGDLTMGGRTNPNGTIAVSDYDHNEADSLGNAVLTAPDPLAGYKALAQQVAAAGIKEITGEVIIDDRLFQPFNFRGQFDVRPIFVNDDVVDLTINPISTSHPASVKWRPVSAALNVDNNLFTSGPGTPTTLSLNPEIPQCIGQPGCSAEVTGKLPTDFMPPLTGKFPLVQTFRIAQPSNYARTVFIEALQAVGVQVDAPPVAINPAELLPPKNSYLPGARLAELTGMPYSAEAKLILKVSYNIGADTSLVLYGLTQGVDNEAAALKVEQRNLRVHYGIREHEYHFVDGSGGDDTTAINRAVTRMLADLRVSREFASFFDALPILGVDGSLGFVTDFESDPTLAGAKGKVRAKTGTLIKNSLLQGQAFGGYIKAQSGKPLIFELVVNNVEIPGGLNDVLQVFQDEGTISAILWRDN
jgi:D-alanyl-D-alanine carboxypeptidase